VNAGGDICKTAAGCLRCIFVARPAPSAHQLDVKGRVLCLMQQRSLPGGCPHQPPLCYIKQKQGCFGFVGAPRLLSSGSRPSFQESLLQPSCPFLVPEPGARPFAMSTPVRTLAAVSKRSPHPVPTQEQFLLWQRWWWATAAKHPPHTHFEHSSLVSQKWESLRITLADQVSAAPTRIPSKLIVQGHVKAIS